VLRAARAAFVVKGYHSTSVADIIRNAGIARGTFYLYFDSTRAIFEELLDGYLERIWGVVGRIEVGPGAPSPVEQLRDNVERVVDVLSEHRELNHILLRHAVGLDADFDQKLDEFYGRLLELIEGALGLGQSMGLVRRGDTRILSACVLGTIKEVTAQYLIAQPVPPAEEASGGAPSTGGEAATGTVFDREGLVREILSYNLHGLLHRREGPASGA
jgi:AcrR family transcriptional regulator